MGKPLRNLALLSLVLEFGRMERTPRNERNDGFVAFRTLADLYAKENHEFGFPD